MGLNESWSTLIPKKAGLNAWHRQRKPAQFVSKPIHHRPALIDWTIALRSEGVGNPMEGHIHRWERFSDFRGFVVQRETLFSSGSLERRRQARSLAKGTSQTGWTGLCCFNLEKIAPKTPRARA